jgi:hypothetical protein
VHTCDARPRRGDQLARPPFSVAIATIVVGPNPVSSIPGRRCNAWTNRISSRYSSRSPSATLSVPSATFTPNAMSSRVIGGEGRAPVEGVLVVMSEANHALPHTQKGNPHTPTFSL